MRACIHRGAKQIGGTCVELESCGQRILIDFGMPLDADKDNEASIPAVKGLDGTDPTLLGIFISHPHFDHFGLLDRVSPNIPVGMGFAARNILKAALPFLPNLRTPPAEGWDFTSGRAFTVGPFSITPYLVDHSAYDSYAFKIESQGKTLFYSGDFRAHGRKSSLFNNLIADSPKNINTLLLEGSSLGRISTTEYYPTESDIEQTLVERLEQTPGLALVHTSSQNIDRIVSIFRASKRAGRKLIIDLYTAAILEATDNKNIPQSYWKDVILYVPQYQRVHIKENALFDLLKKHSKNRTYVEQLQGLSNKATLLFRPIHCKDLEIANCLDGAVYIYSQWEGYWDQGIYPMLPDWLKKHGIEKHSIHTSGHASPKDLQAFVSAMKPAKVVPIHSFHPEKYSDLFPNTQLYNDSEWWEV